MIRCASCKRVNQQWHTNCIECGTKLPRTIAPVTRTVTLTVRLSTGQTRQCQIPYTFGTGAVIHADTLYPGQPHIPLCVLRYNADQKLYALVNKTGHEITHLPGSRTDAKDKATIAPDTLVPLEFPHTVKFTDTLQCRFMSIQ